MYDRRVWEGVVLWFRLVIEEESATKGICWFKLSRGLYARRHKRFPTETPATIVESVNKAFQDKKVH